MSEMLKFEQYSWDSSRSIPERVLWLSVLERVYMDAFCEVSAKNADYRITGTRVHGARDDAIDYVKSRCKEFKQLCWRAGLDDGYVHEDFMQKLDSGFKIRVGDKKR